MKNHYRLYQILWNRRV